jgi:hypothetical protein
MAKTAARETRPSVACMSLSASAPVMLGSGRTLLRGLDLYVGVQP